jgi:DNA-binding NarL/FixJ family response regulator
MSGGVLQTPADALEVAAMLGAAATLPKPFSLDELLDVVRKVLAGD